MISNIIMEDILNMALIKCKECGNEISENATACPHCGCPVNIPTKSKNILKKRAMIAIPLVVIGGLIAYLIVMTIY